MAVYSVGFIKRIFFLTIIVFAFIFGVKALFKGSEESCHPKTGVGKVDESRVVKGDIYAVLRSVGPSVLDVRSFDHADRKVAEGCGVFIKENGWFVTSSSILKNAKYLKVSGRGVVRYIYDLDEKNGIALFKLEENCILS